MEKGKFRISRYLAQQLQKPGKPAAKCRGIFEGRGLGTFRLCLLVFACSAACCYVFFDSSNRELFRRSAKIPRGGA